MATNDFLPFATGGSANVLTQAQWAALGALLNGFQSGIADSKSINKAFRQSSIMSAVLAQFIVAQTGQNATDDGTTATLLTNLTNAVKVANPGRLLNVQVFKINGTYTYARTPGTVSSYAEVQGAGASGGGTPATGAGQCAVGGAGSSGSFGSSWFPTGIPNGTTITVGKGGVAVANGNNPGGSSSIGALMSAPGGSGGSIAGPTTPPWTTGGGAAGSSVSGANLIAARGQSGEATVALNAGSAGFGGAGGPSTYGGGGAQSVVGSNGNAAVSPGAGGGGACAGASTASLSGGAGADGCVLIYEYGAI